jgi:putative SOS response-associated peptidase YedK
MTTDANEFMANIHNRMPVILEKEQFEDWLDPEVHEPGISRGTIEAAAQDQLRIVKEKKLD